MKLAKEKSTASTTELSKKHKHKKCGKFHADFLDTYPSTCAIHIVSCWAGQSTVIVQSPIKKSEAESIHEAQVARKQKGQTDPSSANNVEVV